VLSGSQTILKPSLLARVPGGDRDAVDCTCTDDRPEVVTAKHVHAQEPVRCGGLVRQLAVRPGAWAGDRVLVRALSSAGPKAGSGIGAALTGDHHDVGIVEANLRWVAQLLQNANIRTRVCRTARVEADCAPFLGSQACLRPAKGNTGDTYVDAIWAYKP
jgi:hypothetical protein